MPETVLVVGASGLVGSAAVDALVAGGHRVRGLVRRPESADAVARRGATPIVGDLRGAVDWASALDGATSVVDATQVAVPGRRFSTSAAIAGAGVRLAMLDPLLREVRARTPQLRSFVALGGLEEYAPTGESWFDEAAPKATEPKGYSRLSARVRPRLADAARQDGLPLVTLRMGLVYGPTGWFPAFADLLRRGRGVVVGPGSNFSSLVAASDVGVAIRATVEAAPVGAELLVVDDEPMRQTEYLGILAAALRVDPPHRKVPRWLASLVVGAANVETFASSRRAKNGAMKERLGVRLQHPTIREGFPAALRTQSSVPAA